MPGSLTYANQLTLLRMALAPVLVVLVLYGHRGWALFVFVLAGLTDLFDGFIARRSHQQTTLGAMLDPVADKILLSSAFVALTWGANLTARIPVWLTVASLSRDVVIVVSVLVINLTVGRRIFYPSILGKACTVSQLLSVGLVLLANAWDIPRELLRVTFIVSLVLTILSALHYVYRFSAQRSETLSPESQSR